jgi:hypothetical protein
MPTAAILIYTQFLPCLTKNFHAKMNHTLLFYYYHLVNEDTEYMHNIQFRPYNFIPL